MSSKFLSKMTACILSLVLLISSTSHAAINNTDNLCKAVIDGEVHVFVDSIDRNGNTKTVITNLTTNTTDILTMSANGDKFYLNGELIATVSEQLLDNTSVQSELFDRSSGAFVYVGTTTKTVSWVKSTTAAIVAAVIAAAIGGIGGAVVIAAMGFAVLSVLAAQSTGGTVTTATYKLQAGSVTTYKFVWSFRAATGENFGPFTSYTTV